MDQINHSDFLTANEVSALFRIPLRTIYNLSKSGKIRGVKIGKQWRYKESDIREYYNLDTDFSKEPARKPNDPAERRAYPRINCRIDCQYMINITNLSGSGVIKDISAGGVFMSGNNSLIETGDPVEMRFMLGGQIDLSGRVIRKDSTGFAIKFRNISNEYKERIEEYVG